MADGSRRNAREESYKTPYVKQREKDLKERRAAKAGTGEDKYHRRQRNFTRKRGKCG